MPDPADALRDFYPHGLDLVPDPLEAFTKEVRQRLRKLAEEGRLLEQHFDAFRDDLREHFGLLRGDIRELIELQKKYQEEGPVQVVLRGTTTTDSTGDNIGMDLGGPAILRQWHLRHLIVSGLTWTTPVNGTAELYVGASDPTAGRNAADLVDQTTEVPNLGIYELDDVVLRYPQHLYMVIVSPSPSTPYVAGGGAIDLPDRSDPTKLPDQDRE